MGAALSGRPPSSQKQIALVLHLTQKFCLYFPSSFDIKKPQELLQKYHRPLDEKTPNQKEKKK
jgi:hypothetical protein